MAGIPAGRPEHMTHRDWWILCIECELSSWASGEPCYHCGEWVGHRETCGMVPDDVPLQEVRPGLFTVRRHWMCDAIRAKEQR